MRQHNADSHQPTKGRLMAIANSIPSHRCCTKCGQEKPMADFGNAKKGRYGKKSKCKACEKEYLLENRDKLLEWRRVWQPAYRAKRAPQPGEIFGPLLPPSMKVCCTCKVAKTLESFSKLKSKKDGLQIRCKTCSRAKNLKYAKENSEARNNYKKEWRAKNPAKQEAERKKAYASRLKKYGNQIYITSRLSSGLRRSLKSGKQSKKTFDLLDFSIDELIGHLEKQFLPGMSWDNIGKWHIDHIVPLASFGVIKPFTDEFFAAWGLTNLRPLWRIENQKKSAKRIFLL